MGIFHTLDIVLNIVISVSFSLPFPLNPLHTSIPLTASFLLLSVFSNSLSPISAARMCMTVGPSTGTEKLPVVTVSKDDSPFPRSYQMPITPQYDR